MATLQSLTRLGSDHNPLVVQTESENRVRSSIFIFEAAWLTQAGFREWVVDRWPQRTRSYILDHWNRLSAELRRSLKGWGWNWGSDQRKLKQTLLKCIEEWDSLAESRGLNH